MCGEFFKTFKTNTDKDISLSVMSDSCDDHYIGKAHYLFSF